MDIVFWIILIVVIVAIVLWLLRRNKSSTAPGGSAAGARTDGARADGALEGGSAAASAAAAGTTGIPTAAGFGKASEPAAPVTAEEPAESSAAPAAEAASAPAQDVSSGPAVDSGVSPADTSAATGAHGDRRDADQPADQAEWETQWSEAGPAGSHSGSSFSGAVHAAQDEPSTPGAGTGAVPGPAAAGGRPVHHDEYTAAHAPTLPGAETAAVEGVDDAGTAVGAQANGQAPQHRADDLAQGNQHGQAAQAPAGGPGNAGEAETLDRAHSSAVVENGADHHQPSGPGQDSTLGQGTAAAEPTGHLAADEPYGEGSAAPGPDGRGPADYTVKGDAAAMVYYEEGHPDYEQTRAEVWFESAAHAEAAGFRAPRRKRL